jgi:hypothetical protein
MDRRAKDEEIGDSRNGVFNAKNMRTKGADARNVSTEIESQSHVL